MLLTIPPTPQTSSGGPVSCPSNTAPAAAVRSISVNCVRLDVWLVPVQKPAGRARPIRGSSAVRGSHADAAAAGIATHGRDVGRLAGELRQRNSLVVVAHAAAAEPPVTATLPGLPPKRIPRSSSNSGLELWRTGINLDAVRDDRQDRNWPGRGSGCCPGRHSTGPAVGVAPRVGRMVEGPGVDHRPVGKISLRGYARRRGWCRCRRY